MKCPGCGAGVTQAMREAGECEYCHTALEKPKAAPAPIPVIHVTKIELGPRIEAADMGEVAGGVFDSVTTRLVGCVTGCLSSLVSLAITGIVGALIAGYVGMVLWESRKAANVGGGGPEHEDHDKGGDGKDHDKGGDGKAPDKDGKGKRK